MEKQRELYQLALLVAFAIGFLSLKINYYFVIIAATVFIIAFELDHKGHLKDVGITRKRIWPAIKVQMPFTIAGIAGLAAFSFVSGFAVRTPPIGYLAYWLVSVPLQEFLFRGYAQSILRGSASVHLNVLVVSVVFSLVHFFADTPHTYILMGTTFAAGLAWGLAYEKERNLLGPILSHAILGSLIFLILPVGNM